MAARPSKATHFRFSEPCQEIRRSAFRDGGNIRRAFFVAFIRRHPEETWQVFVSILEN